MILSIEFPSDKREDVALMIEDLEAKAGFQIFKRAPMSHASFHELDSATGNPTSKCMAYIEWPPTNPPLNGPDEPDFSYLSAV